jgi:hypothetical protein
MSTMSLAETSDIHHSGLTDENPLSWQSGPVYLVDLLRGRMNFARLRLSNDCLTLSRLVATHPPASHAHLAAHHIHQHNSVNTHREHTPLTPRSSPCPTQHIHATHIYLILTSHRATILCAHPRFFPNRSLAHTVSLVSQLTHSVSSNPPCSCPAHQR